MLIEILKAVLFGIVEGITEWLPISSTGHMILVDQFVHLNVSADFYKMFEVVIQLGAIMAVVVLSFFKPGQSKIDKEVLKKTLKGIITNPIIIGIVVGLLWSACRLPFSGIPAKTVTSIGNMATPMGLMAMGATFDIHKASAKAKPSIVAAVMKLVGFAAVFLPIAAGLGFKNEEIVAILVMLGSATTVSSYVMAKNMGHEGVLTASTVMLTTMFSAFTLTGWLYILKTLGIV